MLFKILRIRHNGPWWEKKHCKLSNMRKTCRSALLWCHSWSGSASKRCRTTTLPLSNEPHKRWDAGQNNYNLNWRTKTFHIRKPFVQYGSPNWGSCWVAWPPIFCRLRWSTRPPPPSAPAPAPGSAEPRRNGSRSPTFRCPWARSEKNVFLGLLGMGFLYDTISMRCLTLNWYGLAISLVYLSREEGGGGVISSFKWFLPAVTGLGGGAGGGRVSTLWCALMSAVLVVRTWIISSGGGGLLLRDQSDRKLNVSPGCRKSCVPPPLPPPKTTAPPFSAGRPEWRRSRGLSPSLE